MHWSNRILTQWQMVTLKFGLCVPSISLLYRRGWFMFICASWWFTKCIEGIESFKNNNLTWNFRDSAGSTSETSVDVNVSEGPNLRPPKFEKLVYEAQVNTIIYSIIKFSFDFFTLRYSKKHDTYDLKNWALLSLIFELFSLELLLYVQHLCTMYI